MISQLFLGSALAYTVWSIACLEANVRKAREFKVPVVRLSIDENNVFWILLQRSVVSIGSPSVGLHPHLQLGPVWALVSPMAINLHFADPDTIQDILMRRGDFQRPTKELKLLELYGPCISTAKWDDWPRHRKVMTTSFNESIIKFVWEEALRPSGGMVRSWAGATGAGIESY
ncbi:hypothetical protein JX265_013826 [Neoarthrinium moseri]|uniref:Cytochrome P450 n=1 Tax=Neoarthrinium moseri TaxID=1658444 RepID=A0A9Q0AH99_9PEZI|nr:hypothetical protein JX265_013826 [Neoarthrinium moseri]